MSLKTRRSKERSSAYTVFLCSGQISWSRECLVSICVMLCMVMLSGCGGPKLIQLAEIPEEDISPGVRELVDSLLQLRDTERGDWVGNLTWRAKADFEDYSVAVCTYEATYSIPRPRPDDPAIEIHKVYYQIIEYADTAEGLKWKVFGTSFDSFPPGPFGWLGGYGRHSDHVHKTRYICTDGWCLAANVKKIVGLTSLGNQVETEPIGGFWYLKKSVPYDDDTEEIFERIQGLNARGKVLYDFSSKRPDGLPPPP